MPNDSQRPDVAVFIDFENVYVSVRDKLDANPNFEMIMDRCEDLGRVVIARAYADWYRYPRVTSALYANGIEPMYVPTYYYDREMGRTGRAIKNSVDMNLCIDAMKTLFTNPNIAKFVLATGDRDFIPLVNSIRQQGKEVIVIGIGGAASSHLAQSADEFIFYESLIGKKTIELVADQPRAKMPEKGREAEPVEEPERPREREPERPREREREAPASPAQPDIFDTLVRAINLARERGYVCSFGSLKLLMKELMGGDFKEGRYKDTGGRPFAKFKDFVLEAERRGKVQVFTSGTVNEVFLPGEDPYKLSQFAQELKEEPAAPILASPVDSRADARGGVSTNGRRRRRRRGQRPSERGEELTPIEELGEEVEEVEEIEYISPDEILSPGLIDEGVAGDLDALPDLDERDEAQAEAVFEELLERVEEEEAESQALASLDPLELLAPPSIPEDLAEPEEPALAEAASAEGEPEEPALAEAVSPEGEPEQLAHVEVASVEAQDEPEQLTLAEAVSAEPVESQPFTEGEWSLLREVVVRHERPISFAQIHDAMREARNNAGIVRTNEELRTLIKQAINTGMLERSGKGNRVTYRLAPAEVSEVSETAEPAVALEEQVVAPPAAELEGQVLEPPAADLEGQVLEPPPVEIAESIVPPAEVAEQAPAAETPGDQPVFFTPEAAAQAELAQAPAEVEPVAELPTVITADEPSAVMPVEQKPARSRRKRPAEAAPPAPAEPAAPPKRSRPRRKPTGGEASAEPIVQAPAAPEESTQAKPKRTRRKKTENTEA